MHIISFIFLIIFCITTKNIFPAAAAGSASALSINTDSKEEKKEEWRSYEGSESDDDDYFADGSSESNDDSEDDKRICTQVFAVNQAFDEKIINVLNDSKDGDDASISSLSSDLEALSLHDVNIENDIKLVRTSLCELDIVTPNTSGGLRLHGQDSSANTIAHHLASKGNKEVIKALLNIIWKKRILNTTRHATPSGFRPSLYLETHFAKEGGLLFEGMMLLFRQINAFFKTNHVDTMGIETIESLLKLGYNTKGILPNVKGSCLFDLDPITLKMTMIFEKYSYTIFLNYKIEGELSQTLALQDLEDLKKKIKSTGATVNMKNTTHFFKHGASCCKTLSTASALKNIDLIKLLIGYGATALIL